MNSGSPEVDGARGGSPAPRLSFTPPPAPESQDAPDAAAVGLSDGGLALHVPAAAAASATGEDEDPEERRSRILSIVHSELDNMGRALRCAICQSTLRSPCLLPCHHAFCRDCIVTSLDAERRMAAGGRRKGGGKDDPKYGDKCPVCKVRATKRGLTPSDHLAEVVSGYKAALRAFGLAPLVFCPDVEMTQFAPSQEEGMEYEEEEEGGDGFDYGLADGGSSDGDGDGDGGGGGDRKRRSEERSGPGAARKRRARDLPDMVAVHEHLGVARAMQRALSRREEEAAAEASAPSPAGARATRSASTSAFASAPPSDSPAARAASEARLRVLKMQKESVVRSLAAKRSDVDRVVEASRGQLVRAAVRRLEERRRGARAGDPKQGGAEEDRRPNLEHGEADHGSPSASRSSSSGSTTTLGGAPSEEAAAPVRSTSSGSTTTLGGPPSEEASAPPSASRSAVPEANAPYVPWFRDPSVGAAPAIPATAAPSNRPKDPTAAEGSDHSRKQKGTLLHETEPESGGRDFIVEEDEEERPHDGGQGCEVGNEYQTSFTQDARDKEAADRSDEFMLEEEPDSLDRLLQEQKMELEGIKSVGAADEHEDRGGHEDGDAVRADEEDQARDSCADPGEVSSDMERRAPTVEDEDETAISSSAALAVGTIVQVQARHWPGINKPGGVARITKVEISDVGTRYCVAYVLGGKEKKVEEAFVKKHNDVDFVSPSKTATGESGATRRGGRARRAAKPPIQKENKPSRARRAPLNSEEYMPEISFAEAMRRAKADSLKEVKRNALPSDQETKEIPVSSKRKARVTSVPKATNDSTNEFVSDATIRQLADEHYKSIFAGKEHINVVISSISEQDQALFEEVKINLKKKGIKLKIAKEFKKSSTDLCITAKSTAPNVPDDYTLSQYRTLKVMRCAIAGIPIVTSDWLRSCRDQNMLVTPSGRMCIRTIPIKNGNEHLLSGDNYKNVRGHTAWLGVAKYAARIQKTHRFSNLFLSDALALLCGKWQNKSKKRDVLTLLGEAGATIIPSVSGMMEKMRDEDRPIILICDDSTADKECGITDALDRKAKNGLSADGAKHHISVVPTTWLFDCVSCGTMLKVDDYQPSSPRATALWRLSCEK